MGKSPKKIVLTRKDKPVDESSLGPNEYKIMEHWTAIYHGLKITEQPRGETQKQIEAINGCNSIRGEEPYEIIYNFNKPLE